MSSSNYKSDLEQDFALLFENVAQGVIYLDQDGKITEANPAAESLLGFSIEQMKGIDMLNVRWVAIKPNLTDFPNEDFPGIIALQTGQPVFNVVMGVKHAIKKKYIWILVSAVPEFKNGEAKPYRIFISFTDITDQIELETKLRQRNKLFHLISTISQRFINIPLEHLNEEINIALKELGEFSKADRIAIFDYDFKMDLHITAMNGVQKELNQKKRRFPLFPLRILILGLIF